MATPSSNQNLKIGYVPLIDSAPLMVAQEEGFFEQEGISVTLCEEVGWATVRDKMIHSEIDMASTLIGLPYAMHNGVGCFQTSMHIPLIINANGNTICTTSEISESTLSDPDKLAEILNARAGKQDRKWTFATVNPYSTHLILLFKWLSTHFKKFISEIDIVFMPPQLAPEMLEKGMIDGFCAGEPWGSIAESSGSGWIASTSIDLSENHPEKVLAVPDSVLNQKRNSVEAAGRAIMKALPLCDDLKYRPKLTDILSKKPALDMTEEAVAECLQRTFTNSAGEQIPIHKFSGDNINKPTNEKERWVIKGLKEAGLFRKKMIATGKLMEDHILF